MGLRAGEGVRVCVCGCDVYNGVLEWGYVYTNVLIARLCFSEESRES
jgi:hypothetical protein